MFRRYWHIGLAGGLIAFVVLIAANVAIYLPYHKQHAEERERAAKHNVAEHQKDRALNCVLIGKTKLGCTITSPDTQAADEYTKADLKAQQEAAEWSFISMIIGGIGAILSALAVAFTGWAAWAASEAASAAQASVAESVKERRMSRHHVGVDGQKLINIGKAIEELAETGQLIRNEPYAVIMLTNYGQSIAIIRSIHAEMIVGKLPPTPTYRLDDAPLGTMLPIGKPETVEVYFSNRAKLVEHLRKGERPTCHLIVRIEYSDAIGTEPFHVHRFVKSVLPFAEGDGRWIDHLDKADSYREYS
jgi:hypothetical protein